MTPRWLPQKSGHDRGPAVEHSALGVGAGQAGKVLAGKQQMLMAEEYRVDAVKPGEVLPGVLLPQRGSEPGNAGMAYCDDEIDAALESVNLRPRRLDDIDSPQASADMGLVPLRDLRRATPITPTLSRRARPDSSTKSRSMTIECGNQGEPLVFKTLQQTTGKRACA